MSATSFQFRYPLNRNPYIADQNGPIYPWGHWGDYGASNALYISGRQVPSRSYFGSDVSLSARPISRVIEPGVVEFPIQPVSTTDPSVAPSASPTFIPGAIAMGNRLAALDAGNQQVMPLKFVGAQAGESAATASQRGLLILLLILAAGASLALLMK